MSTPSRCKRIRNRLDSAVPKEKSRMKRLWVAALLLAVPLAGCNVPDDDEKISQELKSGDRLKHKSKTIHVKVKGGMSGDSISADSIKL